MSRKMGVGFFSILMGLLLAGCAILTARLPVSTEAPLPATETATPTATQTVIPSSTITSTWTSVPTATETPEPTTTATATLIPEGFRLVPNVVGMHYKQARQVLIDAGLTFIYRDLYDRQHPFGTIVEQEPTAGYVLPLGKAVILYRAFQAPGMWVSEACMPLRMTSTTGKLLFAVYLEEEERYEIKTDFDQGETKISDYRMIVLASFENRVVDSLFFEPQWTGWYVISLGPYRVSQGELDAWPDGVPAGCLWVFPPEEE
jgi:hypothetical protein